MSDNPTQQEQQDQANEVAEQVAAATEEATRAEEAAKQDADAEPQGTDTRDEEGGEEPKEGDAPADPEGSPAVEEPKVLTYDEKIAAAVRPLLNKTEGGSYRVSVEHVGVYLNLLQNPEFKPLWEEKVTQKKEGEDMEKALLDLLAASRITFPEVKAKGDEIVKAKKPKGVWLKGLIATALASERLPEEATEEEVQEVKETIAEAAPEVSPEEVEAIKDAGEATTGQSPEDETPVETVETEEVTA